MRVLVRYTQVFMGEQLFDSYETDIRDELDKLEIEKALYEDPHVKSVEIVNLKNNE